MYEYYSCELLPGKGRTRTILSAMLKVTTCSAIEAILPRTSTPLQRTLTKGREVLALGGLSSTARPSVIGSGCGFVLAG